MPPALLLLHALDWNYRSGADPELMESLHLCLKMLIDEEGASLAANGSTVIELPLRVAEDDMQDLSSRGKDSHSHQVQHALVNEAQPSPVPHTAERRNSGSEEELAWLHLLVYLVVKLLKELVATPLRGGFDNSDTAQRVQLANGLLSLLEHIVGRDTQGASAAEHIFFLGNHPAGPEGVGMYMLAASSSLVHRHKGTDASLIIRHDVEHPLIVPGAPTKARHELTLPKSHLLHCCRRGAHSKVHTLAGVQIASTSAGCTDAEAGGLEAGP